MDNSVLNQSTSLECAVCLDECLYPTRIQCSHIFCYLCLKGLKDRRCPLCRQMFARDEIERPQLVDGKPVCSRQSDNDFVWFYESRTAGDWWQYDERTSREIEKAFARGDHKIEVSIASDCYTVSFDYGVQIPHRTLDRCRQIKRGRRSFDRLKGIAGIPVPSKTRSE